MSSSSTTPRSSTAWLVTGNCTIAEYVVQEVFTTLWCKPERFDPLRGSLRAFLGVQAQRRAVDAVRRDARRTAREERHQELDNGAPLHGGDETESATLAEVVRQAIARLPIEQREAVKLAYMGGRTHRELALLLGIPEGTAKSRLSLMIRLAVSLLEAGMARAGRARPGHTARLVVTGAGNGTFQTPLGPGSKGPPEVRVVVDGVSFCRLVANRVDAREAGALVTGEESLAADLLAGAAALALD